MLLPSASIYASCSVCYIVCACTELWPGGSLVSGVLCKCWPMFWLCISVLFSVGVVHSVLQQSYGSGSPGADFVQRYSGLVHALSSHVLAACSLLC